MTTLRVLTAANILRGVGLDDLVDMIDDIVFPDDWNPLELGPGQSFTDRMAVGTYYVLASAHSASREFRTMASAVAASGLAAAFQKTGPGTFSPVSTSGSVYVRLESGQYNFSSLVSYGENNWLGYANGNRRVMGFIGADDESSVVYVQPGCVDNSTQMSTGGAADVTARELALNATTSPVPIGALYLSNTSTTTPIYIAGVTFRGSLQTPYGVLSAASQTYMKRNASAPTPLPWRGLSIWRAIAGSMIWKCKFEGFGFALNTAPPFEMGAIDTNYDNGLTIEDVYIDGMRWSGGLMWNKAIKTKVINSLCRNTRRSGWATNTNTGRTDEVYEAENFQVRDIANVGDDGWPSDITSLPGGFNGSNVEAVMGVMRYKNVRVDVASGSHVAYAVPASGSPGVYPVPDHITIDVDGWVTTDTLYGGCFRMSTSKRPNATGDSPVWLALTDDLAGTAEQLFDIRTAAGVRLAPVRASQFNSSIHKPDSHYVLTSF